uniref:KIAA1755 n=1 Tax=Castor canadensis TaxID=51338 RepID=A0A8C0WTI9_CASCN
KDPTIQHVLAGLYPPFEATVPTILGQVFRLLDSDFRGDGLSFLLDFLIPAKRLCEQVREAACARFSHCVFLHEGWPLCLQDEVVVHLAPLNPLLLRQGDFYLQVERRKEQSVCLMIKCLSLDLRTVDKKLVPELSYSHLFTHEWLESFNSSSEGSPLHNCLVASTNGVISVPWTKIISPAFIDGRTQTVNAPSPAGGSLQLKSLHLSSPQKLYQTNSLGSQVFLAQSLATGKNRTSGDKYPGLIKMEQVRPGEVAFRMEDVIRQGSAGDYVTVLSFTRDRREESPSREVATLSGCTLGTRKEPSGTKEIPMSQRILPLEGPRGGRSLENQTPTKPASSEKGPCVSSSRRKARHKTPAHNAQRQPQDPHLGVLDRPLDRASAPGAGITEEPAASKKQVPLGNPETMVQLRPGPRQASSPRLSLASPAAESKVEKSKQEIAKPVARASRNISSSSRSPTPGLKFSFLKGQRPSLVTLEKATIQHERPWKALCSLYSPKLPRAKSLGKGKVPNQTGSYSMDETRVHSQNGCKGQGPSRFRVESLGAELLHSRTACLPGGRDRVGRPLLLVSTTAGAWEAPWCTASEVTQLLLYLCTIPRPEDKAKGLVVVMDARKQPPQPGLLSALQATQALVPAFRVLLFLGKKEAAVQLQELPAIQVEVLTSLKALSHHVDPSQLPEALEGPFPYCHSEWVQFFQKLDPFLADLRQASSLLQASIKELEKGEPPGGMQEAARCLSKSKELMEAVLRDPGLLGLQREGGAILARLQCKASRLDSNPDVRSHLDEAATLYSLVDEQLHVLVTASNHLLGRLELRVRLGHLEAAIHQVSSWMEREGSQCLQALTPKISCTETVQRAHKEFEDFFLQAAAQYRKGLDLSKQAAQLGAAAGGGGEAGGPVCPELVAFASTQRAFQAKLTHFYMAAERQRTDLETLLHLHRFCKKMTWFHLDCQDLMAQLRLGKAQKASPGDQCRLHRYLRRLETEFPAEKLTAMRLQVASLSRTGLGQDLWEEARVQHEEIHSLLRKALAHCPCPAAPAAHWANPELTGPAAKGRGLTGEVSPKGKWELPLQDSLGVEPLPKSCWPPPVTRGGQSPLPEEAGHTEEADKGQGIHEPTKPAPDPLLITLFSQQEPPTQSQVPHPMGDSFSSEGTDSQMSLEDSPQTSPPASL